MHRFFTARASLGALLLVLLAGWPGRASAQQPTDEQAKQLLKGTTPEEAKAILQSRPDLVRQLRERIGASGLTPDQVRARLRAAGYPDNLLDDYLSGADTTKRVTTGADVLDAVRAMGIVGAEEADSLRALTDSARHLADSLRADSLADTTKALRLFGLDVFRRTTTLFQPALGGPVDPKYRLGPGDILVLILTGDVELAHTLEVTREGFVVIPQVGQLYVANLTLAELEDLLYARLSRVYSGVRRGERATTKFKVTVSRLRMNQIFVAGDVARPGSYQVSSAGTVLTALYAAGGPTLNGSFRRVEIRRGGTLIDTLDVYDYLLRGINTHDIRLETADVVFVPPRGPRIKMAGKVVRPAIYELRPGETLRDALAAAGGFDATALRRRVQIDRILPPAARRQGGRDRVVIDLASDQFEDGLGPAFPMASGDSVTVFAVADRRRDVVEVSGNVWVAGPVGFTPGMKLSQAIQLAGGPKPDVYLGQILVARLNADSTRTQLRSAFKDSTGAVTEDLALQEDDEIRIFSRTNFRPDRYVAITGAVGKPGRLPFRDGMTLRDAVLESGGLREDAYLKEAEIARLPEDRSTGIVAATIRVTLDSTYIFDRDRSGTYLGPPGLPGPANGAPEVPLEPYDNILVFRQPDWELQRTVAITGQVKYPGRYSLVTRTDRLLDLINRAGGLTPTAYPDGIQFFRTRDRSGRVGVDLPRVLREAKFRDNLILFSGDSINIPEYSPVVTVNGSVNAPVAVSYVPGRNIEYYISAAGGYGPKADRKRAYVAQPSGKVESVKSRFLFADSKPTPLAGGAVYVPERDPSQKKDYVAIFGAIAQILASVTTIIIVAIKL